MQTSIFIAKLLGPVFLVAGLAILFNPKEFRAMLKEFIKSRVQIYMAGMLGLLGGLALVLTHNVWAFDWRLIITLIGWVAIIRALVTIFQPQWVAAAGSKLHTQQGLFSAAAALSLVIGLVLSYFGYRA
jgi:uncharacterized membrane protein